MRHLLILSISLMLFSCFFGVGGQEEEHIIGEYYVGWNDMRRNRSIYKRDEPQRTGNGQIIVSGYVYAVGNNERYIVAKSINGPNSPIEYFHLIDSHKEYLSNLDNNNYWRFYSQEDLDNKLIDLESSMIQYDKNYTKDVW